MNKTMQEPLNFGGGSLLKRLLFVLIGLLFINIPQVNY